MQSINVQETQENLANLLDAVASGEEIIILRNGKPAARLLAPKVERIQFLDRSELRASLPPVKESAAEVVRNLREEERY
jgi:prevent-host-death family protein